jgi:hypothetical protein
MSRGGGGGNTKGGKRKWGKCMSFNLFWKIWKKLPQPREGEGRKIFADVFRGDMKRRTRIKQKRQKRNDKPKISAER